MSDDVEREVLLPVGSDEVWEAITDPEQLGEWFGADVEIDVRPGGPARFRWPDGTERGALVETVEEAERLAYRWLPYEVAPDGRVVERTPSRVEFVIDDAPDGTRLRVVETPVTKLRHRIGFRALVNA